MATLDRWANTDAELPMTVVLGELYPSCSRGPATTVLAVAGELDVATAPEFQAALLEAIDSAQTAVVVDIGGVSFCDCRGFAALLAAARHAELTGCPMRIVNPMPAVRRLFDLLGAEEMLDLS
jgi:anti-sigma B factor antagonist